MDSHRTTARGARLLLTICGAAAVAACALAMTAGAAKTPIVFPVVGPTTYFDDFGDPRPGGTHEGIDILAARKALAIAAEGGTVKFWTTSANAGCMLYLYGDSGTTYLYIHLNNDLGTGNDNKGSCVAGTAYAIGMKSGDRVTAGQIVGYVGDSGDANGIHPHLHFEVHPNDGAAANPYPYLQKGLHLLFSEPDGTLVTLVMDGTVIATGNGTVSVTVDTLKEWPSHQRLTKLGRALTLTLPSAGNVMAAGATQQAPAVAVPTVGTKVRLWSGPLTASAATRSGEAGAIGLLRLLPK
jgi:hypothetical protein